MSTISDIGSLLATPRDIVIFSHRNPDGDAVGSSLGLFHYLIRMQHSVKIILPSEYPASLGFLPAAQEIMIYDLDPEEANTEIDKADLFFCLDFNGLDRIDKAGERLAKHEAPIVMIDHHLYPEDFADYVISDPTASSTCEMVYDFLVNLGSKRYIDPVIADCLFTGILTDTGSFKYSTSPKLFRIVADLLEIGVDDYRLQDLIFNSMEEKQLLLLGHCLNNRMEILPEYHTGIITLTKEDYAKFDIKRGDTEGIVNYMLKLKDVKMAAFIMEQPNIVKISLRSKGDFSVQEIAQRHFRGGGHKNASGGASFQPLDKTVERFKRLLPRYQTILQRV